VLPSPEEILERENRLRKPAAYAALLSAALAIVAMFFELTIAGDLPDKNVATDFVEAINAAVQGVPAPTSYATRFAEFKLDHQVPSLMISVLHGVGILLTAPVVILLLRGARERGGSLARWLEPLTFFGIGLLGASTIASGILELQAFNSLSPAEILQAGSIKDALQTGNLVIAANIASISGLIVGVPLALGAMQAFRVGLIPRVVGLLGVLIGIFIVFRNLPNGPFVIGIWFAFVGMLLLGRVGGGLPEAWATGKAVEPPPRQPRPPKAPKPTKAEKEAQAAKAAAAVKAPRTGKRKA
jgi:hypothetical protein